MRMPSIVAYKAKWTLEVPVYETEMSAAVHYDAVQLGETLLLQAMVSGFDGYDIAYQWQSSQDGETFANVQDADADTYETTMTAQTVGMFYRIVVSASSNGVAAGSATSEAVEIEEVE